MRNDFNYCAYAEARRITFAPGSEFEYAFRQMRFACASLTFGRERVPRRVKDVPQERNRLRIRTRPGFPSFLQAHKEFSIRHSPQVYPVPDVREDRSAYIRVITDREPRASVAERHVSAPA
jgi:hypothetical protein